MLLLHPSIYRVITTGAFSLWLYFIHINKLARIRRCNNLIVNYSTRKNITAQQWRVLYKFIICKNLLDVFTIWFHKTPHDSTAKNILWCDVQWRTFLHSSGWWTFLHSSGWRTFLQISGWRKFLHSSGWRTFLHSSGWRTLRKFIICQNLQLAAAFSAEQMWRQIIQSISKNSNKFNNTFESILNHPKH